MVSELLDLLAARSGTVCVVGAGGKKTTLYHLALMHPGRVGLTCTVPNTHFPDALGACVVVAEAAELVRAVALAAAAHRLVAFAQPSEKTGRYGGLAPELIAEIQSATGFDVLLVKCDGARMRWIKAPQNEEPLIPETANTVIPIVSAKAFGEPLTETVAHRLSRVETVTGAGYGEAITPQHVARLLAHQEGALKNTGSATVVPIINMVDNSELEAVAREAARAALGLTDRFDRIVLTSHLQTARLVGVVAQ
ncbi:MAG: putative selenium-dependent hydroxylase accessory protein YqeC [Gemmatimonadota bacterium]|nr:MAG: putative selenium-dependent hydroxylase accessory protein YqeC [Gemmatimonadota bacterium]